MDFLKLVRARYSVRQYQNRPVEPEKVEQQLRAILPPEESNDFCHRLVLHGRAVCIARRPQCQSCVLRPWCDHFAKSGQTARGTEGREPA